MTFLLVPKLGITLLPFLLAVHHHVDEVVVVHVDAPTWRWPGA